MAYRCTSCQKWVETPGDYCPFCGQQNIEAPLGFTTGKKIKIYVTSVVFAPFGVIWFFKYFRNEDVRKRKVAYISLFITLAVIIITFGTANYILSQFEQIYAPQLELYRELGY